MKLVLIPKGTFMMGSPESEEGRQKDETQNEVTIDDEEGLLPEYGWFKRNSSDRTHTVGLLE